MRELIRDPGKDSYRWRILLALLLAVLATAVYWYGTGMQRGSLSTPMSYEGDALQYGYIIDSFARPGGLARIDNAGAPFGTQNVDFPNGDFGNMLLAALLFSGGYGLGFNLFLLLSVATTAVAGFAISLRCRISTGPALLVGLAFALLPFHFQRIGHLFYTNYATAAVALWLALKLADPLLDRTRSRVRRWLGALGLLAACIWCGTTGVYYAFFTCIVLAVATIVQIGRFRSILPAYRGALFVTGIVLCVALQLLPTQVHNRVEGPNPSVGKRSLIESEIYGLKLSQLLLPVHGHRFGPAARERAKYDEQALTVNENGTATLGALGSAGFMMGLLMLFIPSVRRMFPAAQQLCAVLLVALFIFATTGGLGSLFALLVSPQIRALNRISPFIALFSLIVAAGTLQLAWTWMASRGKHWQKSGAVMVAVLSLCIIYDQVSPAYRQTRNSRSEVAARYQSDRDFARAIAAKLPQGALVMQLPFITYPENPESLGSYTQFRNSLHAPGLRWTHGAMRARPESNWLSEVAALPAGQFMEVVQALGFSALVIDKRAESEEIREKAVAFAGLPGAHQFSDRDNTQTAIFTGVTGATARALVRDGGWHAVEGDGDRRWVWSADKPTLALSPSPPGVASCKLSMSLSAIRPMKVSISDPSGRLLAEASLRPDQVSVVELTVPASTQRILLENEIPAAPPGNGDPRPLALRWDYTGSQSLLCAFDRRKEN